MNFRLVPSIVLAILLLSCTPYNKLTVAFINISSLEKGDKVYISQESVGYIYDFKPNKNLDTLFVLLKINRDIKIPKASSFYLDENLLGPSRITIEYSQQKELLTSKDISLGIFRPLKPMTSAQLDSTRIDIKKLRRPRIDTIKNR